MEDTYPQVIYYFITKEVFPVKSSTNLSRYQHSRVSLEYFHDTKAQDQSYFSSTYYLWGNILH